MANYLSKWGRLLLIVCKTVLCYILNWKLISMENRYGYLQRIVRQCIIRPIGRQRSRECNSEKIPRNSDAKRRSTHQFHTATNKSLPHEHALPLGAERQHYSLTPLYFCPAKNNGLELVLQAVVLWWARSDLNRGPKDYEFAYKTACY